jgi:6-phosphofructokinase
MVKDAFGYKFHWAVADYLQRAARHLASKSDVEQAYALGKAAVEYASPARTRSCRRWCASRPTPTSGRSARRRCREVANVEKFMPKDFITDDGFGITDKCREYLYPLISRRGLPATMSTVARRR